MRKRNIFRHGRYFIYNDGTFRRPSVILTDCNLCPLDAKCVKLVISHLLKSCLKISPLRSVMALMEKVKGGTDV